MTIRNSFVVATILLVVSAAQPEMAAAQRSRGGQAQSRGGGRVEARGGGRAVARPIVVAPRRVVRPIVVAPYRSFYRPYYAFRPRTSFSLGVWVGYAVPYPSYAYAYPAYRSYAYRYPAYPIYRTYPAYPMYPPSAYPQAYPPGAYPPSYPSATPYPTYPQGSPYPTYPQGSPYPTYPQGSPYPTYPQGSQYPGNPQGSYPGYPQGSANAPDPQTIGGMSFEFSPANAVIYVDGQYVGPVSNFTPSSAPLSLAPGRHNVQLQAPNYVSLTFDVDIVAGEVIPYRGSLRPY